jgi:hypothetical protein
MLKDHCQWDNSDQNYAPMSNKYIGESIRQVEDKSYWQGNSHFVLDILFRKYYIFCYPKDHLATLITNRAGNNFLIFKVITRS